MALPKRSSYGRFLTYRWRPGWYEAGFLALILAALGLRLWDLESRTMHYDEAIHLYYSWQLVNFGEYVHSPWMHGPFQIELVALFLKMLGDTDFIARLAYVLFGTALVGLPYLLRNDLGRAGALLTGVLLTVSPALLYFSRFGRNDIIMAFLAATLFILMWRYFRGSKDRYLYLASAVLALIFATKETSYIITVIFGSLAFLLALTQFVPCLFRHARFADLTGPAGFLVLLFTLTLPQWSAAISLSQDWLGLTLVNLDGVTNGIVGAPHWEAPFVLLPLFNAPIWLHGLALLLFIGVSFVFARRHSGTWQRRLVLYLIPVAMANATVLLLARPSGGNLDLYVAGAITLICVAAFSCFRFSWNRSFTLLLAPFLLTAVYAVLFLHVINVDALLLRVLPDGVEVVSNGNGIPLNFIAAGGALAVTALASVWLGLSWKGGVWLVCAGIFYLIWVTLYTTFFTNFAGLFSGVWQGMGYWIAQQEVARGNQPWYYYFVGLSVYESLPFIFGIVGGYISLKRGDLIGLALVFWTGINLLAYTLASEKMPWLLVNITLPFIFLAGKLLGELVEQVPWRSIRAWKPLPLPLLLLALPPLAVVGGIWLVISYANLETASWEAAFNFPQGTIQIGVALFAALLAVASAWLVRRSGSGAGIALTVLGGAALLLGFTSFTAHRAVYSYDDSHPEILIYAQGSADLQETYRELDAQILTKAKSDGLSAPLSAPVQVDYDLWYPFQWYVRHSERDGLLRFASFKDEPEPRQSGSNPAENGAGDGPEAAALLLTNVHGDRDTARLTNYRRDGPKSNLLWFPESYRRPGENRQSEPWREELAKDLAFFMEAATQRKYWRGALNYLIYRQLDVDWFKSEYYSYLPRETR